MKGEVFHPTDYIKLYVVEVKDTPKGPRIAVSRTHPDLVRCLFEQEVSEVKDGTVEIKAIAARRVPEPRWRSTRTMKMWIRSVPASA